MLEQGNHLATRVKSNAVAYAPAPPKKGRKTRGRPKIYGKKTKLTSLLADIKSMQQVPSPVYGECSVTLRYRVRDLLWRPAGRLVRFVAVIHRTRGACILMCTDTSLSAVDIIRLYGLRFKIEHSFKQATRQIGSFAYHFWMKDMIPLRYRNGNNTSIANRSITEAVSNAKCAPITPSSRPVSSPRDCSSISLSSPRSSSGTPSGPGCEPFAPVSHHRSWSSQKHCARHFPTFSWLPRKAILSRNSSPSGRTRKICGFSAWLRDQNDGLLSNLLSNCFVWLPFLDTYRTMCLAPEPAFQVILEDIRDLHTYILSCNGGVPRSGSRSSADFRGYPRAASRRLRRHGCRRPDCRLGCVR
jgi:hypothetical protein